MFGKVLSQSCESQSCESRLQAVTASEAPRKSRLKTGLNTSMLILGGGDFI